MIDQKKILQVVNSGLSIVCATCENHWNAADRGLPNCGKQCGGPMSGDVFHEYKGPMTDVAMAAFCFVCGGRSEYGVRVEGKSRVLGCCGAHINLVKELKPVDREAPKVSVISKSDEYDSEKIKDKPLILKIRGGGDGQK